MPPPRDLPSDSAQNPIVPPCWPQRFLGCLVLVVGSAACPSRFLVVVRLVDVPEVLFGGLESRTRTCPGARPPVNSAWFRSGRNGHGVHLEPQANDGPSLDLPCLNFKISVTHYTVWGNRVRHSRGFRLLVRQSRQPLWAASVVGQLARTSVQVPLCAY